MMMQEKEKEVAELKELLLEKELEKKAAEFVNKISNIQIQPIFEFNVIDARKNNSKCHMNNTNENG